MKKITAFDDSDDAISRMSELLKKQPLEHRLYISNDMFFVQLITELGYRENKYWTDEEDELSRKISELAKKYAKQLVKEFEEWEADGRPHPKK
jgi:hypothetical protein